MIKLKVKEEHLYKYKIFLRHPWRHLTNNVIYDSPKEKQWFAYRLLICNLLDKTTVFVCSNDEPNTSIRL